MDPIDPAQLAEFLRRPHESVERLKAEWWAERVAADEQSALAAGHAMWEHARSLDPDFPGPEYLAEDLAHHIRLKKLIDSASQALARR